MSKASPSSFEEQIGSVLVEGGFITDQQIALAREVSAGGSTGLLETLVSEGMISQDSLSAVLAIQLHVPVVDLKSVQVNAEAVSLVPEAFARQHGALAVDFDSDGTLRIATRTPNDFELSAQLSAVTGRQTKFVLALGGGLSDLIDRVYTAGPVRARTPEAAEIVPGGEATDLASAPSVGTNGSGLLLGEDVSTMPAVQAVEMVTLQAVKRRASDLHLVPTSDSSRVLFRIDGALQEMVVLPLTLHESMVSRVKVLAGMDIAESRRPQDGSFGLLFGERKVEFRVATVGVTWGEMMVIRVLDASSGLQTLENLGLTSTGLSAWRQLLSLPYGMLLVSGPTGAGKTTTLYASVLELVKTRGNIMTVEDPIEYRVEGINQIQVNRAADIDFAAGLRSIMRLDPDVILVGEIRDQETATTAVNAALTGHLVLASIHANDTASSLVRILDLGVEPFLAATAVAGALSQRLVRRVCPHCRTAGELTATETLAYEQEMQESVEESRSGRGCNFCNLTGFSGRFGVFEVLIVDEDIRRLVAGGAAALDIKAEALGKGMTSLRRSGMLGAKAGETTVGEVLTKVFAIE